jgi:nitronate monooxygenase
MSHPFIIQGGMGVGVSGWRLARTVSQLGQIGVVSGAIIAVVLARRLQAGDPGGDMRRALGHFPIRAVAERVMDRYFVDGGKQAGESFKNPPMPTLQPGAALVELTVAAGFAEVFLAKENHEGMVGINLLEKIQLATLPTLYGAMLAKVDYVLMGAGIPRSIPGALDAFAAGQPFGLKIDVEGAKPGEEFINAFNPAALGEAYSPPTLPRPHFLPIVSSAVLAQTLARKSNGRVDGFVIEGDLAGGHNAPPRGALQLTPEGEPVYGPRDVPDLAKFRELGLPFWLAGNYGAPGRLRDALALGAAGIQVGTAFAFCEESGIDPETRAKAIQLSLDGKATVFTDPLASPTGFPFKVMQMEDTLSGEKEYLQRERLCDLGYLRQAFRKEDGSLGYRCASEPDAAFLAKGGAPGDLTGRKCLCNGLAATVGLGQTRPDAYQEASLITAGNDVAGISRYLAPGAKTYSAADVIRVLLA